MATCRRRTRTHRSWPLPGILTREGCNENSPSIEMALKIAKVFDIPVDYLLGEGKHAAYDNETVKRLEDIQTLDSNTKSVLFDIIDTYLRDAKARKAYAQ